MTTNIYKFEEGRLLVHESRKMESTYQLSGVPVRIGQIRHIEEVLSVDTDYSQYGLITPLNEVRASGSDIFVVMRRGDIGGVASGGPGISGIGGTGYMSGIGSGLAWLGELRSGGISGTLDWHTSGRITVTANVIGY